MAFAKTTKNYHWTALNNSYQEGLNPTDYEADNLNAFEKRKKSLTKSEWIDYDLLMTNKLKNYIFHLSSGKLNPQQLYEDWDLRLNKPDVVKMLINIQENDKTAIEIESIKPNHQVYKKLKEALAIVSAFPQDNFKLIEIIKKILPNETNDVIIDIKKRLIYWKDLQTKNKLKHVYDAETIKADREISSSSRVIS